MRKEIINIYTIIDHPKPELCYEWIRNNWHDLGEHCVADMIASLEALTDEVNGKLDYSISIVPNRGEFVSITDYDKGALEKLVKKADDCPLTGMTYDSDVINGLHNGELNADVLHVLHTEGEYIYSDEGLKYLCEINEYEFTEDGKIY